LWSVNGKQVRGQGKIMPCVCSTAMLCHMPSWSSYWFTFSFMGSGPWKRRGRCVAIVLWSLQQKKNGHASSLCYLYCWRASLAIIFYYCWWK